MKIKNGLAYDSNYARAAALGTCAPEPLDAGHLAAYKLITGIYTVIAKKPEELGYKSVPDVSFEPWEQQKGREKDIKYIRGAIDKIDDLMASLFTLVESVEITDDGNFLPEGESLGRTLKKALNALDVTEEKNSNGRVALKAAEGCFKGLKELAAISREHIIPITDGPKEDKAYLYFSRCVFEPEQNWTALAFDKLLDANGQLIALCTELEKRGYTRIDCRDGKKVSLDYVKQHGRKEDKIKQAWGERTHSGIEVSYEELRLEPCFLWIRMPMFKTILENEDKLSAGVVRFIENWTKTCDGCRYCVQTDKTHTRPLALVKFGGKNNCPHFPGFSMNWRDLSAERAKDILALLDAVDSLLE